MSVLSCDNISLKLGGRDILKNVSLDVDNSQVLGLVGPNGAGKTSLFEVLCGNYIPHSGSVLLDGQSLDSKSFHDRVKLGLARTYQTPVVPNSLNLEDVFLASRYAYKPHLSRHTAEWATSLVNLEIEWNTPTAALDTFNRRKLLIACLLMRRPKILLMDEPASGLINTEIDELDLLLRKIADELGIAILLIEHRLELVSAIANKVTVLDLGEIIATDNSDNIFENQAVQEAYFGIDANKT